MIYKEYFISSEFEDVWQTLRNYYSEPESVRKLYKTLFYTIRNLPVDEKHSRPPLRIVFDFDNMIHVAGAPDPIEWLTGREVLFDKKDMLQNYRFDDSPLEVPSVAELAAHLLYWSTLYDFKTQTRQQKDFEQYIGALENGTLIRYSFENSGEALSRKRKNCYYWKNMVANDSAISWTFILDILKKRIEFHIGYHRYTDRFTRSKHYVSRMELCCKLLDIASADYYKLNDNYVNTRNASRFVGRIFDKYDLRKIENKEDDNNFLVSKLYRAKAYKILWKVLEYNLTYWWD